MLEDAANFLSTVKKTKSSYTQDDLRTSKLFSSLVQLDCAEIEALEIDIIVTKPRVEIFYFLIDSPK